MRGDVNGNGIVEESDIFYLVNFLFGNGPASPSNADANNDGFVTGADVVFLVNYFFAGGQAPAP